jgi:hypothetical protein
MSIRTRVPAVIAGATMAAGVLTSAAAYADSWYSESSPLIAYDDDVKQAGAHGASYIQNGSYARVDSSQKDFRPGGDDVYLDTDYKYWMVNNVNQMAWVEKASKETDRTDSSKWIADYTRHTLLGEPDRVRMVTHVCEDQSWHSDPCSVNVIKTYSY